MKMEAVMTALGSRVCQPALGRLSSCVLSDVGVVLSALGLL